MSKLRINFKKLNFEPKCNREIKRGKLSHKRSQKKDDKYGLKELGKTFDDNESPNFKSNLGRKSRNKVKLQIL